MGLIVCISGLQVLPKQTPCLGGSWAFVMLLAGVGFGSVMSKSKMVTVSHNNVTPKQCC